MQMHQVLVAVITAGALTLGGCATIKMGMDAESAISKAETQIAAAEKDHYLWRDTKNHLKGAKKAYADDDYETALKLANKAISEATLAEKQAAEQKGAMPH